MVYCKYAVISILAAILQKEFSEINTLEYDKSLADIGLDSLNTIKLVITLEAKFGIAFRDEDLLFENYDTLEKLFAVLDRYCVNTKQDEIDEND